VKHENCLECIEEENMGNFRIEVNAVGSHGCQREKKRGSKIEDCGQPSCPDCMARRFVAELKAKGASVNDALLIHWPNNEAIVDNLLTGERRGSFS
jgi:hypothetical protein